MLFVRRRGLSDVLLSATRLFERVETSAAARPISASVGATSTESYVRLSARLPSLSVLPSPTSFQPLVGPRGVLDSLSINSLHSNAYRNINGRRERQPTMKFGAPVPSNTAIDSIDQENFKAW
jgi:hypothetical protein